jgi:Sec-independent protein translocase protein TatA|tara:strand:- start:5278 stop:5688 length:411 start_codon:yes stop_codon:yes gene_type:complete
MKMNDIINEVEDNFGLSPEQRKLANYGRILMDQATTTKDDALSNVMAVVGDSLTNFGAIFGAKNLKELVAKTGVSAEVIKKLLNHADNIATTQSKLKSDHADSGLDDLDTDDNDFNEPDDDAMAAQADQAARAKRD